MSGSDGGKTLADVTCVKTAVRPKLCEVPSAAVAADYTLHTYTNFAEIV